MDLNLCLFGGSICQRADAWAVWAAWVQAILTVATFIGTVVYQAKQSSKSDAKLARHEHAEVQQELMEFARFARKWHAIVRKGLNSDRSTPELSKLAFLETTTAMAQAPIPSLRIAKLGPLSKIFAGVIFGIEQANHEFSAETHAGSASSLGEDQLAEFLKEKWNGIERINSGLDSALKTIERIMDSDSLDEEG